MMHVHLTISRGYIFLKEGVNMKRNYLRVSGILMSALLVWAVCVGSAMAANPTQVVVFSCKLASASSTYIVYAYNASAYAPAKSSTDCAAQLYTLLNNGLTNVNVSIQTYTNGSGAPGNVDGTYITYVLTDGILASGNL